MRVIDGAKLTYPGQFLIETGRVEVPDADPENPAREKVEVLREGGQVKRFATRKEADAYLAALKPKGKAGEQAGGGTGGGQA